MKYAFFSSSHFGALVLSELLSIGLKPQLIVTVEAKPTGRHQVLTENENQILAEKNRIPYLMPPNLKEPAFLKEFSNYQFELVLVCGYGKIIPKELLDLLPDKFLNLHPSLLPRWRGASPIQNAILSGDKKTGVSLIIMDEKVDHGPILAQKEYNLEKLESYTILEEILAKIAAQLFKDTVPLWLEGKIKPRNQDEDEVSYCAKINFSQGKINWQKSAPEIWRQVLAFNPEPGCYTYLKSKIFKILSAEPSEENPLELEAGELFLKDKNLFIKCGAGSLKIISCQLEGKKPTSGYQFILGHKDLLSEKVS